MRSILSKTEAVLLFAVTALIGAAAWAPAIAPMIHQHHFADARTLWGIPHAMDVLSNLPFAAAGFAGAWLLWRLPPRTLSNMQRAMAGLFFAGLLFVALGSSVYHLDPHGGGLALDRHCMAVAFAGLLGLAAAVRVSERAGAALGLAALLLGPFAVQLAAAGDLRAWAALQFGGILLLGWMATLRARPGTLRIHWLAVLLAYGAAKLLEMNDEAIYELTRQHVSGHSLKHLVASLAAWPVLVAVARGSRSRQNASARGGSDDVPIRWWSNA